MYKIANKQLKNVDKWLIANKLSLNLNKTKYIIFRTPNSKAPPANLKLLLRKESIEQVSTIKFLGVIVHEHLSWKPHTDYILQKLRISYGVVKKASPFLNTTAIQMLYYSMIQSHLSYCITTWCNGNKSTLLKLQRVANKFIRLIYNLDYRASVKEVMQMNGLLTINQLTELETACFMFSYQKKTLPNVFSNLLENNLSRPKKNETVGSYRTRSGSLFFPSFCRINLTKQSMKYKGPLIWSRIPSNIKLIKSVRIFRNELKKALLNN